MHIEVDSHTHTVASGHAYSTLAENAAFAAGRGIKLMAATDHGPDMPGGPHYWFFMNLKVIPRVINNVGILRGVEANIINEKGELDINEDMHPYLDVILGSLHELLISPSTQVAHTDMVIRAMESGIIDIFAHGGNPSFPIDINEVAKAATFYNVIIEINNSSFTHSRPGSEKNCISLAEAVANHGGHLTFGSDAHFANHVGAFKECCQLVETIGFPKERILSLSASRFLEFISARSSRTDLSEPENRIKRTL